MALLIVGGAMVGASATWFFVELFKWMYRPIKKEPASEHRSASGDRERAGTCSCGNPDCTYPQYSFAASAGPGIAIGSVPPGQYVIRGNFISSSPQAALDPPERVPLPEREGDLPILAYKAACIAWRPGGRFTLHGVGVGGDYTAEATAQCMNGGDGWVYTSASFASLNAAQPRPHEAPHPDCSCGFYASQDRSLVDRGEPMLLLDVELYGRVIVHEHGYRAEKQRVLRAAASMQCEFCGHEANRLVLINGYTAATGTINDDGSSILRFRCGAHVGPSDVSFSIGEVSDKLGIAIASEAA